MATVVPLRPQDGPPVDGPYDAALPADPPDEGRGGGPPHDGGASGQDEEPRFGRVVPLGTALQRGKTAYVLLDSVGQRVTLSARDMQNLADISSLFGGAGARRWLAERWPWQRPKRDKAGRVERDDDGNVIMVPSGDFSARDVGDALIAACTRLGPADALEHRRDGVWPGESGGLAVHVGDTIFTWPDGAEQRPGWRLGTALHVAARPRRRPHAIAATATECLTFMQRFRLWSYAPAMERSAPTLLMGAIAVGVYSGALAWRPHVWLRAPTNAGKSTLLDLLVAAVGADPRSKDVSEPYVRRAFDGRATWIVLDEEEANLASVTAVLNLMRGASDGEGARTGRVIEGEAHSSRIACPFLLAAISTPAFEPADASRITTINLRRPAGGDRKPELLKAQAEAYALHPRLFTRLVQGWERFGVNLAVYRGALLNGAATARCADQLATLLAGHRVLVDDLPIDPMTAAEEINALELQVVTPDLAAETDAAPQALAHLLASRVPVGDGRQSATLAGVVEGLREAVADWLAYQRGDPYAPADAKATLDRHVGNAGALQLRWQADPPGLIIGQTSPLLNHAFAGTPWANRVWIAALRDVEGAQDAGSVKFRRAPQARAVWLPESQLGLMPPRGREDRPPPDPPESESG